MPVRTSRSLRLARETTSPSWNSWKKFHPTIKRYWQEYPQGFSYLNFLAFPYLSLSLSFYIVQGLKHKLRISIQMIIFGSLLTSFEVSIIFWGAWVIFLKIGLNLIPNHCVSSLIHMLFVIDCCVARCRLQQGRPHSVPVRRWTSYCCRNDRQAQTNTGSDSGEDQL